MILSRQEIFNEVKTHLLTQMKKSKNDNRCLYRSPEGLKCAAGIFIPDNLYSPSVEGISVKGIKQALPTIAEEDLDFLTKLQEIHDFHEPLYWEEELKRFRKRYALK